MNAYLRANIVTLLSEHMKEHIRIPSPFDDCNYQIVKETPGQSRTVVGFDDSIQADAICMELNKFLEMLGVSSDEVYYSLEMGPNVPEPERFMKDLTTEFLTKAKEKVIEMSSYINSTNLPSAHSPARKAIVFSAENWLRSFHILKVF